MGRSNKVLVTSITKDTSSDAFGKAVSLIEAKPSLVTIKVNLCDYRMSDSGATTDPMMLGCLADAIRERFGDVNINIIENDATSIEADSLFGLLGFREIAERHSLNLVNAAKGKWITKKVNDGIMFDEIDVPEIVESCDLLVSLAKLKTNGMTKTTGALKNMFGLFRPKRKSVYHAKIDEVITDINKVMSPGFSIVDGMIGMEGLGPAFGIPKKTGLLIAGADPVAVDACAAKVMGFNPKCVRHIMMAEKAGIGNISYELQTDIDGFDYSDYKFKFPAVEYTVRNLLRRYMHIGAAG